jgi:hypothetical protein
MCSAPPLDPSVAAGLIFLESVASLAIGATPSFALWRGSVVDDPRSLDGRTMQVMLMALAPFVAGGKGEAADLGARVLGVLIERQPALDGEEENENEFDADEAGEEEPVLPAYVVLPIDGPNVLKKFEEAVTQGGVAEVLGEEIAVGLAQLSAGWQLARPDEL